MYCIRCGEELDIVPDSQDFFYSCPCCKIFFDIFPRHTYKEGILLEIIEDVPACYNQDGVSIPYINRDS